MKLLLVFALCGVTCCLAKPACTKDEFLKCLQPPSPPGTEEEELDKACRMIECELDIYDRCGAEVFGSIPFPVKGFRKDVAALCYKSSPLREKYLENVECIRKQPILTIIKSCGIVDKPKEEFCREIPDGFKCAVNSINGKCGADARDVFKVAALPYLDPYDCLS